MQTNLVKHILQFALYVEEILGITHSAVLGEALLKELTTAKNQKLLKYKTISNYLLFNNLE